MDCNISHTIPSRANKSPFVKGFLVILMVLATDAVCLIGQLRAEGTPKRNFTTTTQEDMDQIENLHDRGMNLIAQQKFRDAINVYSEALLIEPDDEEAYAQIGQSYMVLGDFKRAKDAFRNALDINPENETARMGLRKISDPD